jgi:hypothetical protein
VNCPAVRTCDRNRGLNEVKALHELRMFAVLKKILSYLPGNDDSFVQWRGPAPHNAASAGPAQCSKYALLVSARRKHCLAAHRF